MCVSQGHKTALFIFHIIQEQKPIRLPCNLFSTDPFKHNLAMSRSYVRISIVLQLTKPETLDKRLWLRAPGSALLVMKIGIKVSASASFSLQYLNLKAFALVRRNIFLFINIPCCLKCFFIFIGPQNKHICIAVQKRGTAYDS